MAKRKMAQKGMVNTSRKVNKKESLFTRIMKNKLLCWNVTMLLVLAASIFSMMNQERNPAVPRLVKDQIASFTVYAMFDFQYEDKAKTNQEKAAVLAKLPLFYRINEKASAEIISELSAIFKEVRARKEALSRGVAYLPQDTSAGKRVAELSESELNNLFLVADAPQLYRNLLELTASAVDNGIVPVYDKENIPWTKPVRVIDVYDRVRESRQLKDLPTANEAAEKISEQVLETFTSAEKTSVRKDLASLIEKLLPAGEMTSDREYTEKQEKAALKQRRKEERLKKKEERKARIRARQEARDARLLQKYIEKSEKQKERDEREQEPEPAGERSPGIEVRGELSAAPRT